MNSAVVYQMRICVGANHQPACHHRPVMREGVEAFLAHPRTRDALRLAIAGLPVPSVNPAFDAEMILAYLANVAEQLDGIG